MATWDSSQRANYKYAQRDLHDRLLSLYSRPWALQVLVGMSGG